MLNAGAASELLPPYDVRLRAEFSGADFEYVDVTARQDESVLCQANRWRHEDGPRQGAVFAARGFEP